MRSTSAGPFEARPGVPSTEPILVVEDDPDFRDAIVQTIRSAGYRVETAATGLTALDTLRWGLRPCLILLDLQMRGMTGWEFRAEQKRDPALAGIPVVAMTAGYWKKSDLDDFTDRIAKPIDLDQLRAILDRHCSTEAT